MAAAIWFRNIGAVIWLLSLTFNPNRRKTAIALAKNQMQFPLAPIVLWSRIIGTPAVIWVAVSQFRHSYGSITPLNSIAHLSSGFVIALLAGRMLLELPGTIMVNSEGIQQSFWFRRNIEIRWGNISAIAADLGFLRNIEIAAFGRTKIVHSWLHVDLEQFILELKQHCGSEFPASFPTTTA